MRLPRAALADRRLTPRQLRVLIGLYSYASGTCDTVWPTREALAERCGLRASDISAATTQLQSLGWVQKTGRGGKSKASHYRLTVPEIVTVPEFGTVPDFSTQTVPESGRGKEETIEETKEYLCTPSTPPKAPPARRFDAAAINPLPDRVPREAWQEFVEHRRERRKPVTERAASMLLRRLASFSDPVAAIEASIANGWTGVFEQKRTHTDGRRSSAGAAGPLERVREAYRRAAVAAVGEDD